MIPKLIHICWLSGDAFPENIQACLDSWKRILPNYEIRLWDTKRFDVDSLLWTKQAFEAKKYAFAADYIRLYALYTEGGIYLDSDVMLYKSFDDLLHLPYFLGEDVVNCFEPAIIGAEKGCLWIKQVLGRYEDIPFINADGSYNMRGLPIVFHDRLTPKYRFRKINHINKFVNNEKIINIFSKNFFNSRDYVGPIQTEETYCSHHFVGTWLKKSNKKSDSIKKILPRWLANLGYWLFFKCIAKDNLKKIQIPFDL